MNSTRHPVRVVVIGCGLIGRKRLEVIDLLEGATLAATVDPVREPPAGTRAPHHLSLRELTPESYDAAIIAVPHDAAPALTEAILAGGKPVLVEKPLATSPTVARKLEELADKVPSPSFVGYNYRFLPNVREVMRIAGDGRLGRLRSIDMLIGHGGHPESGMGWKLDAARAGGGVLFDPGVHLLDLLLQLAPDASCAAIEATRGFWGSGIEEDVAATFRAEMLLVTLRVSHIRWINTFRIEMFGEDASCRRRRKRRELRTDDRTLREAMGLGHRQGRHAAGVRGRPDLGTTDGSFHDELAEVIHLWRTGRATDGDAHPATFAEACAVLEHVDELYARMQ